MKHRIVAIIAAVAALTSLALVSSSVGAGEPGAPTRLNTDLEAGGPDRSPAITSDGSTVVYIAPQDTAATEELFAVPVEGGTPIKLNREIPVADQVVDFQISPDGEYVLYRARRTASGPVELFSVPIGGGDSERMSGTLVTGDVGSYSITPDSSRVVFLAQGTTADTSEIYSHAVDGSGSRVRINDAITAPDQVLDGFVISPDSSRVVYRINDDSLEQFQLYAANVDGAGSDVVVNGTLAANRDVDGDDFTITPDSQAVIYLADQDTNDVFELYRAPIAGGGSTTKLSGTVTSPGVIEGSTHLSPDGQYVVFRLSESGALQLYSARADGTGSRVRLNPTLTAGGQVDGSIFIAPNSQRVVYLADQDTNDVFELYSVPIAGGTSVKVSGTSPTFVDDDDEVPEVRILVTPDSSRVVFKAVRDGQAGLFSGSITGGSAPRISGALVGGGIFDDFKVTPDSGQAIYIAAQRPAANGGDLLFEIWRVPTSGGTPERLNGTLAGGSGDVQSFVVSPTSGHVVYVADEDTDNLNEVYSVALGLTCGGKLATIVGTSGPDQIEGTSGPDVIVGLGGADIINGNGGRDTICGNSGRDVIDGGSAGDTIFGGSARDTISGGTGNDVIEGGSAGDTLRGNGGEDTIRGGTGDDIISGGPKADTIFGNGGRDVISGGKAGDTISGGPKADVIDGKSGRDTIRGNKGADTIDGGTGRDDCDGGSGIDSIRNCE
ncbi:MAG: hypothetical protein AAF480_14355 [Actinomycetota bacterium]